MPLAYLISAGQEREIPPNGLPIGQNIKLGAVMRGTLMNIILLFVVIPIQIDVYGVSPVPLTFIVCAPSRN